MIGPWTHYWPLSKQFGDFTIPEAGLNPPFDISPLRWFNYYLKDIDNGIQAIPAVIYYVMGPLDGTPSSGNVWREADEWPPLSAHATPFYLTPDFGLQPQRPTIFQGLLSYTYDPRNPIPTLGGRNLFLESGPKDQQTIESRDDILVFTTEPLKEDTEATGNLTAHLFFASNQKDTDVMVRLTDVYPDGKSVLISDGAYRLGVMCYQDKAIEDEPVGLLLPSDHILPLDSLHPIKVVVDLGPMSIVFAKGHSIRVSISSSNYPRFEKNLNVGLLGTNSGKFNLAKNTLFVGNNYPSHIILPIVANQALKKEDDENPLINP